MRWTFASILLIVVVGCNTIEAPPQHLVSSGPPAPPAKPFVVHLPGVSGTSNIDFSLREGLKAGGFDGPFEIFDWTCHDPGIPALHNRARNEQQAQLVADLITRQFRAHPDQPIYLTSHSGGSGPAAWALEKLPADVHVACFLMLAPALSPTYDLSKALAHITGHAYCFSSANDDLVLGTGTKMFGTIDGVRCDAAGRIGFQKPPTADAAQYAKLIQKPYEPAWVRYGHIGGHIGPMGTPFVQAIVAPLLLGRQATAEVLNKIAAPTPDVLAQMNPTDTAAPASPIAPADQRARRPWPRWKIILAYAIMFAIAIGSIWLIDGHVLTATPRPTP